MEDGSENTYVAQTFGYPIGSWCVSKLTDFTETFSTLRNPSMVDFDEDVSRWNTSNAEFMDYGVHV